MDHEVSDTLITTVETVIATSPVEEQSIPVSGGESGDEV